MGRRPVGLAARLTILLILCLPRPSVAGGLQDVVRDYDRWLAEADPISAGQRGDLDAASRWPDDRPAQVAARTARLGQLQARLQTVPIAKLAGEDALNRAILAWRIDTDLHGAAFDEARMPFTSDEGFFDIPSGAAEGTVLRSRAAAEAWLRRLATLPDFYATEIDNMRRGLRTGFVQPRRAAAAALKIVQDAAAIPAERDPLLAPFATLPATMTAADRTTLRDRGFLVVRDRVKPAKAALAAFFAHEYLPAARDTIGASALPDGKAYHAYLVRRETTTDMTPDAVMALGRSEVARIRTAMDAQIASSGFHGDFRAFLAMLRTDSRFYVASGETLLEKASRLAKRVDDQLPRFFGRLPRLPYGVRPVPAAIAEGYTTARYFPGSPEQGVAGGLMINTTHLDQRPLYELPALVAHEGAPGHHLQIALAQELAHLPVFRRDFSATAFVEGWALYAEQLGAEMGLYATPYEKFGLLSMEMWRACRLVMDVGIHWLGFSREQALACLRDNTALAERNMQSEVDRYISWPGQALGYKVGELRILALRRQAETAGMDERAFHDLVLDEGGMPLDILQNRVEARIAEAGAPPVRR